SLFLWRKRRLLLGSRHSVTRRTVPYLSGFSPPGTGLCRRRRLCAALLAQGRRARSTRVSRQRFRRREPIHHCRCRRRGKTSGAHGTAGAGAVYLPFAYRDNGGIFVVTRTSQRPEAFAETLRK